MLLSLESANSDRSKQTYLSVVEQALIDIVHNIEIDDNFTIKHPQYNSIKLPEEIQQNFLQLPDSIKNSYLKIKLQNFIFQHYYNEAKPLFLSDKNSNINSLSLTTNTLEDNTKIENNTVKWSKTKFYRDLRHFNHGKGHFEPGWLVNGQNEEGLLKVCKNELTLHIDPQRHLDSTKPVPKIGDLISVKMPPQYVQPGYYIAVSNAGSLNNINLENLENLENHASVVDLYFNINSEGALFFLDKITKQLNQLELIFEFKTLYSPEDYTIADAATLSFLRQDYNLVVPFIQDTYQTNASNFKPEIPLFAKYLAPGLSLAERPISLAELEHFGVTRCQTIAIALIEAWQANVTSPEQKLHYIIDTFNKAGINLERPYLNPGSEDIY